MRLLTVKKLIQNGHDYSLPTDQNIIHYTGRENEVKRFNANKQKLELEKDREKAQISLKNQMEKINNLTEEISKLNNKINSGKASDKDYEKINELESELKIKQKAYQDIHGRYRGLVNQIESLNKTIIDPLMKNDMNVVAEINEIFEILEPIREDCQKRIDFRNNEVLNGKLPKYTANEIFKSIHERLLGSRKPKLEQEY